MRKQRKQRKKNRAKKDLGENVRMQAHLKDSSILQFSPFLKHENMKTHENKHSFTFTSLLLKYENKHSLSLFFLSFRFLPVINSVTGCSTCNLGFISKKVYVFVGGWKRNSMVPAPTYPTSFARRTAAFSISVFLVLC